LIEVVGLDAQCCVKSISYFTKFADGFKPITFVETSYFDPFAN